MDIHTLRKKYLPKQERLKNKKFKSLLNLLLETKYVYHFDWLGVPTIQFPSDLIVIQEILYKYKPDVVIETGVAHGGSLLFYSSILSLFKKSFKVVGIDIKIKNKNKKNILSSNLSKNIQLFESSSIDKNTFKKILKITKNKKVLVILDSNHSEAHVLEEMQMYSKLIKKNGYLIVMDTVIEFIKRKYNNKNRNFSIGNSPFTAVQKFLRTNNKFKVDKLYENKAIISSGIGGFLKRI